MGWCMCLVERGYEYRLIEPFRTLLCFSFYRVIDKLTYEICLFYLVATNVAALTKNTHTFAAKLPPTGYSLNDLS
jgi:hypothetical protein